jgi:hypothetical protein
MFGAVGGMFVGMILVLLARAVRRAFGGRDLSARDGHHVLVFEKLQ